jgi:hypothetical protein
MISNVFSLVAFFVSVKASSVIIHLSCLVCIQSAVHGVRSRLFCGHEGCSLPEVSITSFLPLRFFMLYKHILVPDLLWGLHSLLVKGYRVSLLGVTRSGLEVDYSPPSRTKVKNAWSYTTACLCLHGVDRAQFLLLISY